MLEKMYMIEIVRKTPTVLGPYVTHEALRRARDEAVAQGREVYAAEVYGDGVLHVRRLLRKAAAVHRRRQRLARREASGKDPRRDQVGIYRAGRFEAGARQCGPA